MNSNLQINSNVFLRKPNTSLGDDQEFMLHVRGVEAIRKLLWKAFEIDRSSNHDDSSVMHLKRTNKLTEAQHNTLKEGIFCFQCNKIPVGLNFGGSTEFRCDQNDCRKKYPLFKQNNSNSN